MSPRMRTVVQLPVDQCVADGTNPSRTVSSDWKPVSSHQEFEQMSKLLEQNLPLMEAMAIRHPTRVYIFPKGLLQQCLVTLEFTEDE